MAELLHTEYKFMRQFFRFCRSDAFILGAMNGFG